MQFNEYQEKIAEFAIYPDADTGSEKELSYLALGLVGEAGEIAEKTKKLIRDGVFYPSEVGKELGDVLWYLARYASALGVSLNDITQENINKLTSRKERGVLKGSGDNR